MNFYSGPGVTRIPENASHYSLYLTNAGIGKTQLKRETVLQLSDTLFICVAGKIFLTVS